MNLRCIARTLKVNSQSVANWVNAYVEQLPPPRALIETHDVIEMDEFFMYQEQKNEV